MTGMHPFDFATLGGLLFVAMLVAMLTRKLDLPYSVGLVVAGIGLSLLAPHLTPPFTTDLIYFVFLPPLVFEAAIQIPWKPFRRDLPLLLALVLLGVSIAAVVVAAGMHWLIGWTWIGAALFGVLISATDPVAVIATFRALPVPKRLHLLVESDSLLNDGIAAVGFSVLAAIAAGSPAVPGEVAIKLLVTVFGGVAAGAVVAFVLLTVIGRTSDRLVEITITMLIAYGAFLLAEHFHASGVLATLTAGIIVGNYGFAGSLTDDGRKGVLRHWEYVAFLINSLIFLLIGGHTTHLPILQLIVATLAAVGFTLLGRAVAVYPVMAAFGPTRLCVPWAYKHVLFWGGLRGALALALALALPKEVAERGQIITVCFAVVSFSIIVQGLSTPWLIRRLGLAKAAEETDEDEALWTPGKG